MTFVNNIQPPKWKLQDSGIRDHCQSIVSTYCDFISTNPPFIGDCSILPYPKKTILYAIRWLRDHYESVRETATDLDSIEVYDKSISDFAWLLTHVADIWHQIEPGDKDANAELNKCESFTDWALPLKRKHINNEASRKEVLDVALKVIKNRLSAHDDG